MNSRLNQDKFSHLSTFDTRSRRSTEPVQMELNDDKRESLESNQSEVKPEKIVQEFQYLLEKSQQLFAGLRDLPPMGKGWQAYFQRTFEVYTTLWKFQQDYRAILENKSHYGLKRWEIGEIASKIGQLYYHYYLRSSETNYLHEAFAFYDAIKERQYFRDVLYVKNTGLMVKKLRYFARFIVVALLMGKRDLVTRLANDLKDLLDEYARVNKGIDQSEWSMVITEVTAFLEAEKQVSPVDVKGVVLPFPMRIPSTLTPLPATDLPLEVPFPIVHEAIIIGSYPNQVKFSELTIDMYRMIHSLEREATTPTSNVKPTSDPVPASSSTFSTKPKRTNPHKYLLYSPTLPQILMILANAFKDVPEHGAMLLYMSAQASESFEPSESLGIPGGADGSVVLEDDDGGGILSSARASLGYTGGIFTARPHSSSSAIEKAIAPGTATGTTATSRRKSAQLLRNTDLAHCLHAPDLVPFTRKPLFVIFDTPDMSRDERSSGTGTDGLTAFLQFSKVFPAPVVVLVAPSASLHPPSCHAGTERTMIENDLVRGDSTLILINAPSKSTEDASIAAEGPVSSGVGNVFTLFLTNPLKAMIYVSGLSLSSIIGEATITPMVMEADAWQRGIKVYAALEGVFVQVLARESNVAPGIKAFLQDDATRTYLVRFLFCDAVIRKHRTLSKKLGTRPTSYPSLPPSLTVLPEISVKLNELIRLMKVAPAFTGL